MLQTMPVAQDEHDPTTMVGGPDYTGILVLEHPVISRALERMSGTPVFAGSRVPVRSVLDWLEHDHTLAEYFDSFPHVKKQARTLLQFLNDYLAGK